MQSSSKVKRRGGNLKSSVASPSKEGSGGKRESRGDDVEDDDEDDPPVLEQIRRGKNTPDYDTYLIMIKALKKSIHKYDQPDDRFEEEEDEDQEHGLEGSQVEAGRPPEEEEESLELEEEIEFLD